MPAYTWEINDSGVVHTPMTGYNPSLGGLSNKAIDDSVITQPLANSTSYVLSEGTTDLKSSDPNGLGATTPYTVNGGAMGYAYHSKLGGTDGSKGGIRPGTVNVIKRKGVLQTVESATVQGADSESLGPATAGYGTFPTTIPIPSTHLIQGTTGTGSTGNYVSWINYESGEALIVLTAGGDGDPYSPDDPVVQYQTYQVLPKIFGGTYYVNDIIFPNWQAGGVVELFGFVTNEELGDSDAEIKYQFSADNGLTWKYWNTGGTPFWATGNNTDATFSTAVRMDEGIATFPFDSSTSQKQLKVKARLFPSTDNLVAPVLKHLQVNYEMDVSYREDFIRSLKGELDANLRVRERQVFPGLTSATTVTVDVSDGAETIIYEDSTAFPLRAYNLTDDPGQTTELVTTLAGGVVTFGTAQTGTVVVEVFCSVPVEISQNPFMGESAGLELSTTRAIILESFDTDTNFEYNRAPLGMVMKSELEVSANNVRTRNINELRRFYATLLYISSTDIQASRGSDTLEVYFRENRTITSLAVGDQYSLITDNNVTDRSAIAQGLFVKEMALSFVILAQDGDYVDTPLATKVITSFGVFTSDGCFAVDSTSVIDITET